MKRTNEVPGFLGGLVNSRGLARLGLLVLARALDFDLGLALALTLDLEGVLALALTDFLTEERAGVFLGEGEAGLREVDLAGFTVA